MQCHTDRMEAGTYVEALEREGGLLAAAARDGLDKPIAACPGWVVADVVGHLGRVYRSVTDIVSNRLVDQPTTRVPKPPAGDEVVEFFTSGLTGLVEALRATPDDVPVIAWGATGTVAFYNRRMTHETAVHRFDVQRACGPVDPFDADLAADGVSELYEVVLPFGLSRVPKPGPVGSLHLHRTDGPGEWTLEMVDGALQVTSAHGKSTAAVRGPGSDLFVFAWNRGRSSALEVFGDVAVADAWAGLAP